MREFRVRRCEWSDHAARLLAPAMPSYVPGNLEWLRGEIEAGNTILIAFDDAQGDALAYAAVAKYRGAFGNQIEVMALGGEPVGGLLRPVAAIMEQVIAPLFKADALHAVTRRGGLAAALKRRGWIEESYLTFPMEARP